MKHVSAVNNSNNYSINIFKIFYSCIFWAFRFFLFWPTQNNILSYLDLYSILKIQTFTVNLLYTTVSVCYIISKLIYIFRSYTLGMFSLISDTGIIIKIKIFRLPYRSSGLKFHRGQGHFHQNRDRPNLHVQLGSFNNLDL